MAGNAVIDVIRARRSIRDFQDRQIEREQLLMLLEAAICAPSGSNSQSWLFTAIQNKEALQRLNQLVKEGFQRWTPDDDYPPKQTIGERAKNANFNFYHHAPALIIASNRANYENAMADCSLALENIFLTAQSLGLGSCYINQLRWLRDDGPLRDCLFELGIPKEHVICSSAAVGYAGHTPPPPARRANTIHIISPGDLDVEIFDAFHEKEF
ncbi:MAG: nitroreductase family protein [Synergistaceae bacterium]|jgi:nitroreductase|nr:nitroreductase family protein [Synergistaceae bacterium]